LTIATGNRLVQRVAVFLLPEQAVLVDGVVPILQDRGLFHREYDGTTLREHLGAPAQYGIDPRVTK